MPRGHLLSLPDAIAPTVYSLAADVIEEAASVGTNRWGLSPFPFAIRINVGWTEILTADLHGLRLIVDGDEARRARLPALVKLVRGKDPRGYYPSVPGSVLAEVAYGPPRQLERAIAALKPALNRAIHISGKRPATPSILKGHSPRALDDLRSATGRDLPDPGDAVPSFDATDTADPPKRVESVVRRIVRDTAIVRDLKALHRDTCQRCGKRLKLGVAGFYSEGHHLRPLGRPHDGPDNASNISILCPKCHALLDFASVELEATALRVHKAHSLAEEHIEYHNRLVRDVASRLTKP